jgi:hypothetical protein
MNYLSYTISIDNKMGSESGRTRVPVVISDPGQLR